MLAPFACSTMKFPAHTEEVAGDAVTDGEGFTVTVLHEEGLLPQALIAATQMLPFPVAIVVVMSVPPCPEVIVPADGTLQLYVEAFGVRGMEYV